MPGPEKVSVQEPAGRSGVKIGRSRMCASPEKSVAKVLGQIFTTGVLFRKINQRFVAGEGFDSDHSSIWVRQKLNGCVCIGTSRAAFDNDLFLLLRIETVFDVSWIFTI